MDRRVEKTKTAIKQEVINSLYDNEIEKITVKSICDKININRSTFYLHYSTINDVIGEIEDNIIQDICAFCNKNYDTITLVYNVALYVKENLHTIKPMAKNIGAHFFNRIAKSITPILLNVLQSGSKTHIENIDYIVHFILGGSLQTFKVWVDDDCKPNVNAIIFDFLRTLRIKL